MKKNNIWKILIIILLVATLLRVWGIESESYWLDESISIRQAQEKEYSTTFELVKNDIHLPLHISILHFWVKLFGTDEFATRSLSVLFGVLSIPILYLLAKQLFNKRVAIISSIIFAVSPIMIYYSQEARLYSLFVFLSLLSMYFYVRYLEDMSTKKLLFYGLASLFLIYTHLFSFLVLFVQNVFILYRMKLQPKKLYKWFIGQFILFILFLPWIANLIKQVSSTLNTMWIPKPSIDILLKTLFDFFGSKLLMLVFVVLIVIVLIRQKYKHIDKEKIVLLLLWFLAPLTIVLGYSFIVSPVYHTRYMLFIVPALIILYSVLIDTVTSHKKYLKLILIVSIVILSLFSVSTQVNTVEKDDWKSVSEYITTNVKNGEAVFINPFYHHDPFTYYYDSECFLESDIHSCNYNKHNLLALKWDADCCTDSTRLTATDNKDTLDQYIGKTIWLISVREELYGVPLSEYFEQRMDLSESKQFGEIMIYKFESKSLIRNNNILK